MAYVRKRSSKHHRSHQISRFRTLQPSSVQNTVTQRTVWAVTDYQKISKDTTGLEVAVAWLIYIARDSELSQLEIGCDATECYQYNDAESLPNYAFPKTVMSVTLIDVNDTFSGVRASVEKYYDQLPKHKLCLPDTPVRHNVSTTNDLRGNQSLNVLGVSLLNKQSSTDGTSDLSNQVHDSLMTLQINKENGAFRWIYNKMQISEEEINRISSHLLILLASAKHENNTNKAVAKLTLLPKNERDVLLHGWNQAVYNNSCVCCLHQLFEAQAKFNGRAIAVECERQTMSYSELNIQANRLAHYLIARGVKPENRIALCVRRSTAMIVAIMGILKAGCAYVPFDPVYSSQRLSNILCDADPVFLLADATGRQAFGDHRVPVIDLENTLSADMSAVNPDATKLELIPAHLAYIIYTSGSTGTPKGVMVEHQHVVHYFEAIHDKFDLNKQDKWCLFHSISFDFSVWEICGALLYGSHLAIVPQNIIDSANEFYAWLCINRINILGQTPSAFKNLLRADDFSLRPDQLLYIFVGGEALEPTIVRNWYESHDNGRTVLSNSYGPTETTVDATVWICDVEDSKSSISPIGRPLTNKRIYLLDSCGEPVPLGVEGEIFISGAGVARGYLNRPELTMERFLPDPFNIDPSARMYRTGDLARYLPDGNLVFLGRADQQVKIRGFRIELGEIETRLVEHPQVHEAVVESFGDGSNTHLVAYVVADPDTSLVQNLRSHLLNLLPDYMVPAAYVRLSILPLTPNGKLDRRALPVPDDGAFARQLYECPKGEMEEKLADIWCDLLNIDRISRHDNFFELGGHSLLVMHFVSKAKLHNVHIDARGVYSFPVLKTLAEQITKRSKRIYCDVAIPVRTFGNEVPLFLLPDGGGDISYAFELAHDIDKDIPVYVLPWPSPEDTQPSSIEEMAKAIIPFMKRVKPNGPCAIAGYSAGGILAYEITKQLISCGYPVSFLGLIDTDANIVAPLSQTKFLLESLRAMYPNFKVFNNSIWLDNVSEMALNDAIQEIRKTNLDNFDNVDIEWQTLLLKQCYNYQHICAAYKIDSIPIKVHLFKASDAIYNNISERNKMARCPELNWKALDIGIDINIISLDGDHLTMMKNSKNRRKLGEKLTEFLLSNKNLLE